MKYKLIVFDFDGTLADTFPWFASVLNKMADTHHFKRVGHGELDALRGCSTMKIIDHLEIPSWKIPIIATHMRSLMAQDIGKIRLFKGVDSVLRKLSDKGAVLAVVSSNSYDNISRVLGSVNLSYMNFTECGASMFGKASKLKKVLNKSGVESKYAIFIGDEVRDIEAAKKVNISSGAVAWGYNNIQKLKEEMPHEMFFEVNEIYEKIA